MKHRSMSGGSWASGNGHVKYRGVDIAAMSRGPHHPTVMAKCNCGCAPNCKRWCKATPAARAALMM